MGKRIAFFISPHGFGHAAREMGVMEALASRLPNVHYDIYTKVPQWFFQKSLSISFTYHSLLTDVGLVQKTPLEEDLPETIKALNRFLPFDETVIDNLVRELKHNSCDLVVCDIAAMGIVAAQKAGIPSVLVENFTWDWIYQGYSEFQSQLNGFISYLEEQFKTPQYHILAEPFCTHTNADLITRPICRKSRKTARQTRKELGIPKNKKLVIITMGGIPDQYNSVESLTRRSDICFLVPGGNEVLDIKDNVILLPHQSDFYHPDLIEAGDVVIGKIGYSTLAEIYQAGVPFGYIPRANFRESDELVAYIEKNMTGMCLKDLEYQNGKWLSSLDELLQLPRLVRAGTNGAGQVALFLEDLLS